MSRTCQARRLVRIRYNGWGTEICIVRLPDQLRKTLFAQLRSMQNHIRLRWRKTTKEINIRGKSRKHTQLRRKEYFVNDLIDLVPHLRGD